jgi:predicted RNA-binding protein with PIN domain
MALARILVDGFSLLHSWPELAPGKPRHSPVAREELIQQLTQFHDACGTPITIVFDGASARQEVNEPPSTPGVEILYSRDGQTADQLIERSAYRLRAFGEVLVVTDDFAERDLVASLGAMTSSCKNFIDSIQSSLAELEREVRNYNQKERTKFRTAREL